MNKSSLGVHEVKLVVQPGPGLGDGGGVGEHTDGPLHLRIHHYKCHRDLQRGYLGEVTARDHSGRLVVDADLEASGTPVHKLDGPLGLDGGDGSIDILGDHVSPVEHAAGHVLA